MNLEYNKLRLNLASKILMRKVPRLSVDNAVFPKFIIKEAFDSAEMIIEEFKYRNTKKPEGEYIKEPTNTLIHHYKCRGCGELDKVELDAQRKDFIEHRCPSCGHINTL